jgi:hypothetical protein
MKKPSMKNKLTADKIEEANRLLAVQNKIESNQSEIKNVAPTLDTKMPPAEKSVVEETATPEKSVIKAEATKPKAKAAPKQAVIKEAKEMRQVRITIDVPEDLHEKLKIKMILSKQTIKDYLLNFIEKDLGKMDYKF